MKTLRWRSLLFAVVLAATSIASYGCGGDAQANDLWLRVTLQEHTAYVTLSWNYTPPPDWEVVYESRFEQLDGAVLAIDTAVTPVGSHTIDRLAMDVEYRACGANVRLSPSPDYADACAQFTIPARPLFVPLVVRSDLTAPDSVPHEARFEVTDGTIWLEFTPNDVVGLQGLWAKDFNGFETGGHLSVWLAGDTVYFRIQSDTVSYEHWATSVVPGQRNQVGVKFGADGFRGWLNAQPMFDDAFTGGLVGNQNAIVHGAMSQGVDPWTDPLRGTLNVAEFYDGDYDFTDRWAAPPVPPIDPPSDLGVDVQIAGDIDSLTIHVTDASGAHRQISGADSAIVVRYEINSETGDTTWHYSAYPVDGGVLEDLVVQPAAEHDGLQLTALAWQDGEVVACSGDCLLYPDLVKLEYHDWPLYRPLQQARGIFPPLEDVLP